LTNEEVCWGSGHSGLWIDLKKKVSGGKIYFIPNGVLPCIMISGRELWINTG